MAAPAEHRLRRRGTSMLVLIVACFGGGHTQPIAFPPPSRELQQGECNASVPTMSYCALDPKVAPTGRDSWPTAGLTTDISMPIFGQNSNYTLFADHLAFLIHQIFRDADLKEPALYTSSSPGECYFPLLYYTCASAYHECREDKNTSVRVERQIFPPPAPPGGAVAAQDSTLVVLEPLKVPRYPCTSFCKDPQVRRCKDTLLTAINTSLAGLPTLPHYLGNITDWFNCTKLEETSKYSRNNAVDVCLPRPLAPSPPPLPPPPYTPPMPPTPPVSPATRLARPARLVAALAAATALLVT